MEHARRMGQGRIAWLLLKFSIPATLGTLMNAAYNIVDRIFVGQAVGEDGLAALMVAFPIAMIFMAFGIMIGFGSNTLISIHLGERRKDEAEKVLGQGVFAFMILAVVFMTLGLMFLTPLLKLFGASEAVLPYAKEYTTILILGVFFNEVSFGVNSFIRGEGNPGVAMVTMIIGCGGNIVLDWLFVWVLGWGIGGAAMATVVAQGAATVWVFAYYLGGFSTLRLRWRCLKIHPSLLARVAIYGFPPFFMTAANCAVYAVMNKQLGDYGGDTAIAVMGVIFSVSMVVIMPVIGLSQGMQPLIGYNFGARRYDRVAETFKLAMLAATTICLTFYLVVQFVPHWLFIPFTQPGSELIEVGAPAIRRFLLLLPVIGVMIVATYYFLARKRPGVALFLSVTRQALLLVPLLWYLPRVLGLPGVFTAGPISDAGAFLVTSVFIVRELLRLKHLWGEQGAEVLAAEEERDGELPAPPSPDLLAEG